MGERNREGVARGLIPRLHLLIAVPSSHPRLHKGEAARRALPFEETDRWCPGHRLGDGGRFLDLPVTHTIYNGNTVP